MALPFVSTLPPASPVQLAAPSAGVGDSRLPSLLELASEAFVMLTASWQVSGANPALRRVLGVEPATALGRPWSELVAAVDWPAFRRALEAAGNTPDRPQEIPAFRAGGGSRWLEATVANRLADPAISGLVITLRDVTDRVQALERLERTVAATRHINTFAASLVASYTEDDIVWEVTRRCISVLGFEDCVIYLLDPGRQLLVQRAAFGPKNPRGREILAPITIPLGQGIVGAVAASGRAEIIPDTRLDPRYLVDDQPRLSEITVPIISEGRVLGVIDAEHSQAGFFTAEHLTILSSIASICAAKLVRARTEQELRRLNLELERRIDERTAELRSANELLKREAAERNRADGVQRALLQISEAVHAADDLPSLYARIHEIIGTLMPARNFYLALHDETTDLVSFPYHRDAVDPPPPPRAARRGMTEYVLRTGRATLADLAEIQRLKEAGEYIQSGHPSAIWLGVPLAVQGRTFGVMAVQDHFNPDAFGEEEKRLLSFVAGQTALAIERKRAEEELRERTSRLRESEQRFFKAFRSIPANVSIVRADTERFIEVNEALLNNSGFRREEVIGKSTRELGLWVDDAARTEFLRRLKSQGYVHSFETRMRMRSGQEEFLLLSAELIEFDRQPCILALSLPITDRKQAEEELLRSLARERELSRLKSGFVSLVSHEFRTPIGIIHSSAEILERYFDRLAPEDRRDHLKAIQSHAWRMAGLMEEVLKFGQVEAGKLEFRAAAFDLCEACERWVRELEQATEQIAPVQFTAEADLPVAQGDADLVGHVINNLLANAIKYSPPGRPVRFALRREGAQAVFQIQDRGVGIPAADREKLFTAFQRGGNVRHLPGTGLGLVVIKHCLDLHQGTIELHSEENVGTAVTVRIPLFGGNA